MHMLTPVLPPTPLLLPKPMVVLTLAMSSVPPPPPRPLPPPPPPSPISPQLCLLDANILLCYSLVVSITGLFKSGEYLEPPIIVAQDFIDISLAFGSASSLILAWLVAGSLCGACREDWLSLEAESHESAPLGASRLLTSWAASVPLLLLERGVAAPPPAIADTLADTSAQALAVLVVLTLWRRWLLRRNGVI